MENASFLSLDADDDSNMMYAEFTQKFGMDGSSQFWTLDIRLCWISS